jgi:enamine deaminase RidA (YjgF/YER057c/UK114 family)
VSTPTRPSRPVVVVSIIIGLTVLFLLSFKIAARPNAALTVRSAANQPFADSVTIVPGHGLFFTWGVTPSPRAKAIARGASESTARYGDTYAQTRALMTQLTEDLRELGLSLRDVAAVRANIVAEPALDMAGWNRAFGEFFGTVTNPHKPARTTIGISRLFHPDYLAEVEFVVAVPPGNGPFAAGSRFERLHGRLRRVETNPNVKSYGRPTWPLSTGKATAPNTALYFQSAMYPDPAMPRMATMPLNLRMFRGDLAAQAEQVFTKHAAALQEAGLSPREAIFSRNILYPDPKQGGFLDFAAFNDAYRKFYHNDANANRLARTIMSAPGYAKQGQLLTVETYAAYSGDVTERFFVEGKPVPLRAYGLGESAEQASGVATAPNAALTFVSGIIAPERGSMKAEAEAVFALARERLAAAEATFDHVVQLRAYLAVGNRATDVAEFQKVFATMFAGAHKPAVTIIPVLALAHDALAEVEFLAATLPGR